MKIRKIRPMFTSLVTTMEMYVDSELTMPGGIIDVTKLKKGLKEYQKVLAVGSSVRNINVGDMVCINPSRYEVRKYEENSVKKDLYENNVVKYNFNVVNIDGKDCLLLDERDIDFVVEEYEE